MLAITLLSLTAALVAQASVLEKRQIGCQKIYHLHARGTAEPGNLGILVGTPFSAALKARFPGQVQSVGVPYSASIAGAITGAISPATAAGSQKMASMARQKMSQCPQTKVVLSGYSQGAEQVHGALKILGRDAAKVGAAVTFGDPMNMGIIKAAGNLLGGWGALPKNRAKVFCYGGDPVCGGIGISHLSYASSAPQAAAFVSSVIGGIGSSSGGNLAGLVGKGGKGLFGNGQNSDKGSGIAKGAKNKSGKGKGKDKDKDTAMRLADNYDMPSFVMDAR